MTSPPTTPTTIVQKFGGTSVGTPQQFLDVARRILQAKERGHGVIVVVSAMGQTTDELIELARSVTPRPPRREMDMLLTAGERISMALLAMALERLDAPAISFTGSQSGIISDERHSDARIVEIRPMRIEQALEEGRVVIVAGFQGVSSKKEVTTLGRGGSDTTAVALAIRFASPWCEIFTDVPGVLTADPRIVPAARRLDRIGHDAMIVLSHLGAQVLFRRSVILARKFGMPIRVLSSMEDGPGTWIGPEVPMSSSPGGVPTPAASPMETDRIVSVALEPRCVAVEIEGEGDAAALLGVLEAEPTAVWTWVEAQPIAPGKHLVRGVAPAPGPDEEGLRERCRPHRALCRICREVSVASLVGEGIVSRPSLLAEAWRRLVEGGIEVRSARSASLSLSFVVPESQATAAVRRLHEAFVEEDGEER